MLLDIVLLVLTIILFGTLMGLSPQIQQPVLLLMVFLEQIRLQDHLTEGQNPLKKLTQNQLDLKHLIYLMTHKIQKI